MEQFERTEWIFGKAGMAKLFAAKIAVFGIGGVGGYAVEALARSGVGRLDLFDHDRISLSNLNRQIHTTRNNIGQYKVDAARTRIGEINPEAIVATYPLFLTPETSSQVAFAAYDYIIDAIDTVAGKIELAVQAKVWGVPIISAMGAGNKIEASCLEVADIYETSVCPLARVMRHELRKRGIKQLKVVYSKEAALSPKRDGPGADTAESASPQGTPGGSFLRRQIPGSNAFVPAVAGLIIAGEVVKDLTADCIG